MGMQYSVPLMIILVCHEMGHFVQAWRNGVYASLPYFIPMPLPPIGTMGAVIAMEARMGHRRALFRYRHHRPAGRIDTHDYLLHGGNLLVQACSINTSARSRVVWRLLCCLMY